MFFFLMIRPPPRSTLFPYPPLFRSQGGPAGSNTGVFVVIPIPVGTVLQSVPAPPAGVTVLRSEEHTSELQSRLHLVCRLLLEKKKKTYTPHHIQDYTCCKHMEPSLS